MLVPGVLRLCGDVPGTLVGVDPGEWIGDEGVVGFIPGRDCVPPETLPVGIFPPGGVDEGVDPVEAVGCRGVIAGGLPIASVDGGEPVGICPDPGVSAGSGVTVLTPGMISLLPPEPGDSWPEPFPPDCSAWLLLQSISISSSEELENFESCRMRLSRSWTRSWKYLSAAVSGPVGPNR